jgi:anthranilate phosphoribosyltransferase
VFDQSELKSFGGTIQKLIQGDHLSRKECYGMFCQILTDRQPDLQQGAFLAALVAKGETPEEIAGAWQAIDELDTVHAQPRVAEPLVENSGTGMDQMKTFNVSSAAAIVAAAGGVKIARHGARALTSVCGAVDILEAVGVEVEGDVPLVARSIEQSGIGIFNGMSSQVHPRALGRILSQIRFGSTLNIAASLAHPCRPTHAVRGVYSAQAIPKVAAVMREIGYRRGMVVHGFDHRKEKGMDELSVLGESRVCEFFPDGTVREYFLTPEEFGITRASYEGIAPLQDREQEAIRFLRVLAGVGDQPCLDFVSLNAGAVLYVSGQVENLAQGVQMSNEILSGGRALEKLAAWVTVQQGPEKKGLDQFNRLLKAAELSNH